MHAAFRILQRALLHSQLYAREIHSEKQNTLSVYPHIVLSVMSRDMHVLLGIISARPDMGVYRLVERYTGAASLTTPPPLPPCYNPQKGEMPCPNMILASW